MIRLFTLSFCICSLALAFQLKNHKKLVDKTFKEHPHIKTAVLEMINGSEEYYSAIEKGNYKGDGLYGTVDKPDKWIAGKRRFYSGQKCLAFLLAAEKANIKRKSFEALLTYKKSRSSKELEQKDRTLMMNRAWRGKIQKGIFKLKKVEGFSLCKSKLPEKLVDKKQNFILRFQSKSTFDEKAYFASLHPRIRGLFTPPKNQKKEARKGERSFLSEFLTKVLPELDKMEKSGFIASFNEKCPGTLKKVWNSKCRGRRPYRSKIYKNLDKANCLRDNKKSIEASCFSP